MNKIISALFFLVSCVVFNTSYAQIGLSYELSEDSIPLTDEDNYLISNNNKMVVYKTANTLYSVPVSGGTTTSLLNQTNLIGDISYFQISEDSQHVVFLMTELSTNISNLFSVPISGGQAIKLSDLESSTNSFKQNFSITSNFFDITSDSKNVVYMADQEIDGINELFVNSILGGASKRLNPDLDPDIEIQRYSLSLDGGTVAFSTGTKDESPFEADDPNELFRVELAEGTPISLFSEPNDGLFFFGITPDNLKVVFSTKVNGDLYSQPISGGSRTQLNYLNSNSKIASRNFRISNDSQYVVYWGRAGSSTDSELFSSLVSGGNTTQLTDDNATVFEVVITEITDWEISSDSNNVVFTVFADFSGGNNTIKSIPISGGQAKIIGSSQSFNVNITPDGKHVVHIQVDSGLSSTSGELQVTSLDDNSSINTNTSITLDGTSAKKFEIGRDGSRIFYPANSNTDLNSIWLLGGGETRINNQQSSTNSTLIRDFQTTNDGAFIIYRTREPDLPNSNKLFARQMKSLNNNDDQMCIPVKTKSGKPALVCI